MTSVVVFAGLLFAFTLVAKRLERLSVSAPITFTVAGFLVAEVGDFVPGLSLGVVHALAEITLVVLLFHDASKVRLSDLRGDAVLVARLLFIGLPLTIGAGYLTASWLFPAIGVGLTLFLAATLAPTDAALGAPTVLNPVVPTRIRRVLNVESGLNDGLATPIVLLGLAIASGVESEEAILQVVVVEVALGTLVGVLFGFLGGWLDRWTSDNSWSNPRLQGLGMLALPLLAYSVANLVGGNGFIAAFVAGLLFAVPLTRLTHAEESETVVESVSDLLGFAVWFIVGGWVGPILAAVAEWQFVVYATLSLTALRMVPVALSLVGTRLRRETVLFVGWFGPRGLASVIFLLLSVDILGEEAHSGGGVLTPVPGHADVLATIGLTVLLSILLHGLSGNPLAERYGAWFRRTRPPTESVGQEAETADVRP